MKGILKRNGISTVIVASIAVIAFCSKNVSRWLVIAICGVWFIAQGVIYFIAHKDELKSKTLKVKSNRIKPIKSDDKFDTKYAVMLQLAHRITDKLHSAYPEATWQWKDKPSMAFFSTGGRVRITTVNTEEFNEADVVADSVGRIDIRLIQSKGIAEIMKNTTEKADTDFTIDVTEWYEKRGKQVLVNIITELNARGTKTLTISEDGNISTEETPEVGKLPAFPARNLWAKLIEVFTLDNLEAEEVDGNLKLNW